MSGPDGEPSRSHGRPQHPTREPSPPPGGPGSGGGPPEPPRRVRVTSPLMSAARRSPSRPATREIDEQTGLGEVYMRSLLRSQLRLALTVLAATAVLLGGLPLLFALAPAVADAHLLGLPLPWLLLGVLAYPMLWLAARYYVRQAERNEAEFSDTVRAGDVQPDARPDVQPDARPGG